MKSTANPAPRDGEDTEVKIVLNVPENVRPGFYCNFAQIKHGAHDFIIDFAVLTPPESQEDARRIRKEGQLVRDANVRIILPATVVPALAEALQIQIVKWRAAVGEKQTDEGETK